MLTPAQASLRGRIGAHQLHATHNSTLVTANARQAARRALDARLLGEIDPENTLSERERLRRLEHARKAHFARLALKSAVARRRTASNRA